MKRWCADINPRERVGIRSLPPPLRADFLSIHQPTLRPQNRAAAALCRASSSSFPPFFAHSPLRVDRTAYPFEKKKSRKRRGEREREAREKEDPSPVRARFSPLFSASVPFDLLPPHCLETTRYHRDQVGGECWCTLPLSLSECALPSSVHAERERERERGDHSGNRLGERENGRERR